MELYLFRHAEWKRIYNCSSPELQVDLVPLEQRRQFIVESWAIICLGLLYYTLYAPCLMSIWRHCRQSTDSNASCYRLLFYIGIMDMSLLWMLTFLHGFLSLDGAVFCSRPGLIYWTGMFTHPLWVAESSADLILAFNRCLEMLWPEVADTLFSGHRTSIWLLLPSVYAIYWFIFKPCALFTAVHFGWFFDPFVGYRDDTEGQFYSVYAVMHNITISVTTPIIYLLFAIAMLVRYRGAYGQHQITKAQLMVSNFGKKS